MVPDVWEGHGRPFNSDMTSYTCFSEVLDENMYVLNIWFGWMSKMIRC